MVDDSLDEPLSFLDSDSEQSIPVPSELAGSKLHVVGAYGSVGPDRIEVEVKSTETPIVLSLAAYQATRWKLNVEDGAKIAQVIVGGYFEPLIEGVPDGVPVYFSSYLPKKNRDYFFGHAWHSKYTRTMVKRLKMLTGLDVATFQGEEKASFFRVDGIQGTSFRVVSSYSHKALRSISRQRRRACRRRKTWSPMRWKEASGPSVHLDASPSGSPSAENTQ